MMCDDMKKFKSAKITNPVKEIIDYIKSVKTDTYSKRYFILSIDLNVETENQDSGMTYETHSTYLCSIKKKDDAKYIEKLYKKLNEEEKQALIYSVYLKNENSDLEKRRDWIYALGGNLDMEIL